MSGHHNTPKLAIKFLIPNNLTGSLIGPGGGAIKELVEVTEARINVSNVADVYPGTSDRIVFISGSLNSVDLAQNLLWDMFALNTINKNDRSITWSPRKASQSPGEYDDIQIKSKISIPASAAGMILGKGGSSLREIGEESGATVIMNNRDDAIFTQERILTISGTTGACAKCTSLILIKLNEELDDAQYVNRGTRYSSHLSHFHIPGGAPGGGAHSGGGGRGGGGRGAGSSHYDNRRKEGGGDANATAATGGDGGNIEDAITSTTITLTVPDTLVGNILGKQGCVMKEIMSLSGAKVAISERAPLPTAGADSTSGTEVADSGTAVVKNRTVTITGSPAAAQTAHIFITQKLQLHQQSVAAGGGQRGPRRSTGAGKEGSGSSSSSSSSSSGNSGTNNGGGDDESADV